MVASAGAGDPPRIALEVCVESPEGAAAAIAGGCDRIELCAALALGGLTPSAGLVEAVLAVARPAGIPVRAMVRPRQGGFDYDAADLALAQREATALLAAGVQGLVFGATRGGRLDREALAAWRAALPASPIGLTLHRAIDVVDDPVAAVEEAVALGFDHILTSGGALSAPAGAATIARMVERAAGRLVVMAGAGVAPGNVADLVAATGVQAVHGSASEPAAAIDPGRIDFGPLPRVTSRRLVAQLRQVIDDKSNLRQL
ncbi:copper homeostasis protein CutC [Sphingomonas melonis]|uniref:PF03932 family protein CutC n=1 Tax=Sphingomonas melonis TaxID=152682 RepID=A0A7Y9K1T7_9SPHN|nr:copper homeostasis protein CutC [Sphingomonas melonis]NYD91338.1 copper homeostasis protein [Sphingomonas melonis]